MTARILPNALEVLLSGDWVPDYYFNTSDGLSLTGIERARVSLTAAARPQGTLQLEFIDSSYRPPAPGSLQTIKIGAAYRDNNGRVWESNVLGEYFVDWVTGSYDGEELRYTIYGVTVDALPDRETISAPFTVGSRFDEFLPALTMAESVPFWAAVGQALAQVPGLRYVPKIEGRAPVAAHTLDDLRALSFEEGTSLATMLTAISQATETRIEAHAGTISYQPIDRWGAADTLDLPRSSPLVNDYSMRWPAENYGNLLESRATWTDSDGLRRESISKIYTDPGADITIKQERLYEYGVPPGGELPVNNARDAERMAARVWQLDYDLFPAFWLRPLHLVSTDLGPGEISTIMWDLMSFECSATVTAIPQISDRWRDERTVTWAQATHPWNQPRN